MIYLADAAEPFDWVTAVWVPLLINMATGVYLAFVTAKLIQFNDLRFKAQRTFDEARIEAARQPWKTPAKKWRTNATDLFLPLESIEHDLRLRGQNRAADSLAEIRGKAVDELLKIIGECAVQHCGKSPEYPLDLIDYYERVDATQNVSISIRSEVVTFLYKNRNDFESAAGRIKPSFPEIMCMPAVFKFAGNILYILRRHAGFYVGVKCYCCGKYK